MGIGRKSGWGAAKSLFRLFQMFQGLCEQGWDRGDRKMARVGSFWG